MNSDSAIAQERANGADILSDPDLLLSGDLRAAARSMGPDEARFLVDGYYLWQEKRIQSDEQIRALAGEPNTVLHWLSAHSRSLEARLRAALDAYSDEYLAGRWAKSITGIGPVIAAGLLAHIDIERAPTAGHIWSFAGLNPDARWEKGQRRPWNASLKVLCWKAGASFVKQQNRESDVYGTLYAERRAQEQVRNEAGEYAGQAEAVLAAKKIGKDKLAYYYYAGLLTPEAAREISALPYQQQVARAKKLAQEGGVRMLPPAHMMARSTRWAVKMFLAHYHHVLHESTYGKPPPKPYVLTKEGHAHYRGPPNWPMARAKGGESTTERRASHLAGECHSARASQRR